LWLCDGRGKIKKPNFKFSQIITNWFLN
jgi:hypothetical protein